MMLQISRLIRAWYLPDLFRDYLANRLTGGGQWGRFPGQNLPNIPVTGNTSKQIANMAVRKTPPNNKKILPSEEQLKLQSWKNAVKFFKHESVWITTMAIMQYNRYLESFCQKNTTEYIYLGQENRKNRK